MGESLTPRYLGLLASSPALYILALSFLVTGMASAETGDTEAAAQDDEGQSDHEHVFVLIYSSTTYNIEQCVVGECTIKRIIRVV